MPSRDGGPLDRAVMEFYTQLHDSNSICGVRKVQILFSVNSTAARLGVSRSTLYNAKRAGLISAIKQGKLTMFHNDEIQRYIESLPAAKSMIS